MTSPTWCGKKISRLKFAYFSWMAKRLPPCKEILPLISREMDSKLPLAQVIKVALHKHICEWCKRYADQVHIIQSAVQSQDVRTEQSLSSDARERMKRALQE
jgi:hypothetical protein